ncbi:MAG: autotransporter-associated beta strand repeat-containing protein, partial [Verrucomicrobiae bacterium]
PIRITGGTLATGLSGGDLWVVQGGTASATTGVVIGSQIVDYGTSALTKGGARALYLTNTNNTYAGGTYLGEGILNVASAGSLGSGALNFTGPGTLQAAGTVALGSRAVTIGTGVTATFDTNGNNITVGGVISGVNSGLNKFGQGTLTLTGANTYSGTTLVTDGTLKLDFSAAGAPTSNIINPASLLTTGGYQGLNLNGGGVRTNVATTATLSIQGKDNTANTQAFTGFSPLATQGSVAIGGGMTYMNFASGSGTGSLAVNMGGITYGGTAGSNSQGYNSNNGLDITTTGNVTVTTTSPTVNGLINISQITGFYTMGFVTFNKSSWATLSGNQVISMPNSSYAATAGSVSSTSGTHLDVTANATLTNNGDVGSDLRFNNTLNTPSLNATLTLSSVAPSQLAAGGSILVSGNVGAFDSTITGGYLAGNGRRALNIFQYNTAGSLVINSNIVNGAFNNSLSATGLSKFGAGNLTLTATNGYTGMTFVNEGTVLATGDYSATVIKACTLNTGTTVTVPDTTGIYVGQPVTGTGLGTGANYVTVVVTAIVGNTVTLSATNATPGASTLTFASGGALGGAYTGVYIGTSGTLQIGNGTTHGSLDPTNTINNLGSLVISRNDTNTFANTISGTVATNSLSGTANMNTLEIKGGGNTTLGYNGTVNGSAPGSSATYTLTAPGNVYAGMLVTGGNVTAGTTVSSVSGSTVTLSANTGGAVTNATFTTANTFAGTTKVSGGSTLTLGSALALGNSTLDYTQSYNGTFTFGTQTAVTLGGLKGDQNLALTNNAAAAVALNLGNNNIDTTYSGNLTGTGSSLTKTGIGTTILAGTNSYTGGTTISQGTLQLGSGSTSGNLSSTGAIVDNGNLTINRSNAVIQGVDFSGAAITGSGSFTQAGTGATTLNATNTFTGGVNLNAGTLNINKAAALGTVAGPFTINGGTIGNTSGTFIITSNYLQTWNNDFAFTGAGLTTAVYDLYMGTGAVSLGAGAGTSRTITVNSGTLAEGGIISNGATANSLIKAGAGALSLSGVNTFTGGVTLNNGTLNINNAAALGNATVSTFTIAGGALADTSGGAITTTNAQVWNGDFGFSTNRYLASALNAVNGGVNTVMYAEQALTLNGNATLGTAAGTTRTITSDGYYSNLTVGGIISDGNTAKGVTKAGTGLLTLNGANTFSGGVTLNAGTLQINAGAALGTGTLTITGGSLAPSANTTFSNNNAQVWNGAFSLRPLTSSSSYTLNMGNGAITLAGNSSVTDTIGALTVPGAIGDSGSNYGVTWVTGYSSTASTITLTGNNTYGGPTVVQSLNGSGSVQLTTGNLTNTSAVTVNGGGKFNVGTTGVGVTNRINPTASLTLGGNGGGSFVLLGSQNATVNRQTFASLNIGAGVNGLTTDQSSNISTITFNGASGTNYIRNVGGVVNFGLYSPNGAASFTNTVTGTGNISGSGANAILIGAYSMGNWLVGLSGGTSGTLVAATTTSSWGSGLNTAVAAGSTATGTVSQSLSFAGGVGGSLTLPGAFTVESGGILGSWQTTGMTTITGGSLKGRSSGDLWIAQCTDSGVDAVHGMIINSQILDNNTSSLTYGGGRALYLTNTNNTYAGGTYIGCGLLNNGNILNVASAGSLGTGAVNFTGAATLQAGGNADLGSRAVTIGTGVTATFDTNGNNVTVGGVISGVNSGLTKVGLGTLTLTGQNTYTGITSLRNGTLKLDFSASGAPTSNIINPNSLLSVSSFVNAIGTSDIAAQSDTLIIQGAANTANSQTFGTTPSPLGLMGSTSIGRGMTNMVFNAGSGTGTLNVNLGDIYRNYGYLDVSTTGSVTVSGVNPNTYGGAGITGYLNSFNSSTGGDVFATFNKSSWATVTASGNLTGMADSAYTTNNTGGMADITTSGTLPSGNNSAQTLRFNDTANTGVGKTVTLSTTAVSQLSYGGILVTAHVGAQDSTISGGFLAAVNNGRPLNIFQNNTSGNLVINSQIMDGWNPSLIAKNGAGTLILNGVNSNSSDFFVNEGKVIATGNYTASSVQTVVIPNGVAGSITVQVDDSSKLFVGQVLNISSLVVPNGGRQNVVTAIIDATHVTLTTSTASFTTNSTSGTFQSGGALGGYNYAGTSKTPIEYIANGATLQIGSAATGNSGGIYPAMQISNLGSFILSHSGNYTFGNQITGTVATNSISGTVGAGTTGLNTLEITGGGNTTLGSDMAVAGTALTGATTFVLGAQGNVYTGQNVTGTGFQAGTLVSYVDGLNVYLSKATTGNVTTGNFTTNGNTFNGATTITGNSTLILGSALALQNSTLLYNSADSGTFSFGTYTAATLGGLGGDKNLALTNNASAAVALTLGGNNFNTAYSGNLTGSGASLIKNGIGITTLSGTNSYSGGTTVNTGTLQIGSATGLGASSGNVTVAAGATLDLNATMTNTNPLTLNGGGFSIAALTNSSASPAVYAGTVAMASDTNIGGSNGTLTLNGIVSGTFNLSKVGTDTLIFGNVANTFGTGKTFTIVAGTVQLGNAASLGAATNAVSLRDGAALDLNGQSVANTNPLTINGTGIASGGALTNTSATGASYAGLITLGSASSIIASSGNITISNASTITGSTFGLTLGGAYNGSLASIIGTTTGSLTKQDAGTWTLSGTNTYSGKTIVQNGTLSFSVGNASATANQQLGANATLDLGVASTSSGTLNYTGAAGTLAKNINALGNGSDTIHNSGTGLLTLSGNLTKDGTKLTLNGGTYGITVTGVISGSSAGSDLVITGGTTTLTNLETYNGPTYIQGNGTLVNSRSGGALPTGTTLTIGGTDNTTGTFDLGGNAQTVTALNTQGTGGALNVVTNNGSSNATLTVTGGGTFAGMIQDGTKKTSLAVTGGTFILSSANTFTGNTTVSTGTLEAGAVNALATTSAITVTSSGTLLLSSGSTSNSTTLALEGGKVALKTGTSVSTSLGALTLTENSIIDFGLASSTNILNLGSATWTPGKTIQIWNWSGTPYFGGGTEQLMVSGKSGWEDNLSSISFYTDSGSSLIGGGGAMFAGYELVAVPEPATWSYMAAIALGGAVLLIRRRRLTGRLKF